MRSSSRPAPVLSIIVPVLNEARTIEPVLQALQPLRQRGVEVIVADGGSSDATVPRARPLADQVIRAPRGRALQMNEGAKAANGFIFLFLHSGTRLPEDADMQVMYGRGRDTSVWGRFDIRFEGRKPLLPLIARYLNWRSRVTGIAMGEQAIFVQRETFFRVGGFADIPVLEDIELCKRLRTISPPICVTSRAIVPGDRWDEDGIFRTLKRMWMMRLRYRLGADPYDLAHRYRRQPKAGPHATPAAPATPATPGRLKRARPDRVEPSL